MSAPIPPSAATRALAERPFTTCYKPTRGEFNFAEANAILHAYDVVREWDRTQPVPRPQVPEGM